MGLLDFESTTRPKELVMTTLFVSPRQVSQVTVRERRRNFAPLRRYVSRRLYLPALSVVALALTLITIGWTSHWGGSSFAASMSSLRVVVVGPATLVILAIFMVIERLRPAQRRPIFARGYRQDLLYTILNATLVVPLATALALSFVEVTRRAAPWVVLPHASGAPKWGIIGLLIVIMDFCNWFAHFANHRVRVLWRFHELHHSQEDMSVLTVFRTHPLIHVSYLLALVPGIVLLANGAVPTTLLVVYASVVAFEHSNTNLGFGPLDRVFVSPNYHRIHHQLDGPQDVNLGFALTIWDQLFRRAVFPTAASIRADTGLPGRPLAVEQMGARPQHLRVMGRQLVGPFRPLAGSNNSSPSIRSCTKDSHEEQNRQVDVTQRELSNR
jgi:sterol desaturase/sphingolipid hydroxylase (fatty acid hydroxylase superfamily)